MLPILERALSIEPSAASRLGQSYGPAYGTRTILTVEITLGTGQLRVHGTTIANGEDSRLSLTDLASGCSDARDS
jgi:hypothetical protein